MEEDIKRYWPYIVGGFIGLYLIWRYMSSGSSGYTSTSTSTTPDYTAMQYALEQSKAQADYVTAAGVAGKAALEGAATVINAFEQPAINAIAGAYANTIAAENASKDIYTATASTIPAIAQQTVAMQGQLNSLAQINANAATDIINAQTNAFNVSAKDQAVTAQMLIDAVNGAQKTNIGLLDYMVTPWQNAMQSSSNNVTNTISQAFGSLNQLNSTASALTKSASTAISGVAQANAASTAAQAQAQANTANAVWSGIGNTVSSVASIAGIALAFL